MKKILKHSELLQTETLNYEKIGKVTAESVLKHTGKNWKQWVSVLEKAGARRWTYQEIVVFLEKKQRLTPWWQQGVALGFEIATGRRKAGQDAKGKYTVTATKSLRCTVKSIWKFLISAEGQELWLKPLSATSIRPKTHFETSDGFFGEFRTITVNRRMRLYWQDPAWEKHTVVEVMLVPRPGKKGILAFNHSGIDSSRTKELLKARWREAADRIAQAMLVSQAD